VSDRLAGDAVLIAPVSIQVPWYQGILQGILRFWGSEAGFHCKKSAVLQRLLGQFPTEIIRENNLKNKEL
jgi:hypothetical protein